MYRWLLVAAVLLFGCFLAFPLAINDNALNMLPDTAVKSDLQKLQNIGLVNRIFITLSVDRTRFATDAEAQSALMQSAAALSEGLEHSPSFSQVIGRLPKGYEQGLYKNISPHLPNLLDSEDLGQVGERITPEGLEKQMYKAFSLLNSPTGIGFKKQIQQDPLGLTPLVFNKLNHLRTEFTMQIKDGFFLSEDGFHCLVQAESSGSLIDSNVAFAIENELAGLYKKTLVSGVNPRVIGSLPHTVSNARTVQADLRILLPVATMLLITLLVVTIRNVRAFFIFSIPFLAAPLAIGLTSWWFGEISRLALGFGVVLLGIAVDFSVHLYLSLSREPGEQKEILKRVGRPILFATLTTISVFSVLFLSVVTSHRQMAVLAFVGVLFAVLLAWLIIPAIVKKKEQKNDENLGFQLFLPQRGPWKKVVLVCWGLFVILGVCSWPNLKYNGDLTVLDAKVDSVVADEEEFIHVWGDKGNQAFVIAEGATMADALNTNSTIYTFLTDHGFTKFQSIASILPGSAAQQENIANWNDFWSQNRPEFDQKFKRAAQKQGFSPRAFQPFFKELEQQPELLTLRSFDDGPLATLFSTMLRTVENPLHPEQKFMVLTTVAMDDQQLKKLLTLEEHNPQITVLANGKWRGEIEYQLKKDMLILCALAGLVITLLVTVQFRRLDAVLAVLAPVLSALSAMSVFCWLTGSDLNMMHVIMGIMVIGLSVDYGIFIVCSLLSKTSQVSKVAVSICAASSLIGFGVLAFADHPALYSLGITVLVGIGVAWPVAIFISPLFIRSRGQE